MARRRFRTFGLVVGLGTTAAALAPVPAPAPPLQDGNPDPVKALGEARIKAAGDILGLCREFLIAPPGARDLPPPVQVADEIQSWSRELADARLDAAPDRAARLAILREEVDRARKFAGEIRDLARGEPTGVTKLSAAKADYYRIEAEGRLARLEAEH